MQKMRQKNDYGYVRVAAAKPIVVIADPMANVQNMLRLSQLATDKNVQVVVFPELGITGYSCGDLFLQDELLATAELAAKEYIGATKRTSIISIFGMPLRVGGQLFNVAVVCQMGKVLAIIPKLYIPNYKEFYELRHFSPADRLIVKEIEFCGQIVPIGTDIVIKTNIPNFSFGIEVCEDLWMPIPPSSHLVAQGATVIFNLSASNELVGKADYRRKLVENQSARGLCAYVYASCGFGESTSDVVWSGHLLIADNGSIVAEEQELFDEERLLIADVDVQKLNRERRTSGSFSQAVANEKVAYRQARAEVYPLDLNEISPMFTVDPNPFVPRDAATLDDRCKSILQIQTAGLMKRLSSLESVIKREVVIGISGGLDSLLTLLVTVLAYDKLGWDRKGIIAVTMPGFGTTKRTKNNAIKLCKEFGVTLKKIPIKKLTLQLLKDIEHKPCMDCLICENSQARIRTLILMSLGFVIGTGDLSELVLGWCTYNGDHMSMYNPNCGVPKTLVKFVVEWVARKNLFGDRISKTIMDVCATPISPELLPGQQTETSIGKYDLNDFFIFHVLRNGFEPEKIYYLAGLAFFGTYTRKYIKEQLVKFYQRMFAAQFKRNAVPDGIKVGSVAVSPRGDLRAPSDAMGRIWIEKAKNIEV
ncbi:MAG: NAD(+) synthase [Candidatus Moraniibacteriota bacterium]